MLESITPISRQIQHSHLDPRIGVNLNSTDSNLLISLSELKKTGIDEIKHLAKLDLDQDGYIFHSDDTNADLKVNSRDHRSRLSSRPYGYGNTISSAQFMQDKMHWVASSSLEKKVGSAAILSHEVPVYNLPIQLEDLKILHLSDLHFKKGWKERVDQIDILLASLPTAPDIVLLTGDLVHDKGSDLDAAALKTLSQIPCIKFFVMGDHDRSCLETEKQVRLKLNLAGFTELKNQEALLKIDGATLRILGIDDIRRGEKIPAFDINPDQREDTRILITHNLDAITQRTPHCIDLVLSGHTHAGQINLGPITGIDFLKLFGGYSNLNSQTADWKSLSWRTLSLISNGFSPKGIPRINAGIDSIQMLTLKRFQGPKTKLE
jgi:predicted MPP superfamily phosphohydrolase